RLFRCLSIEEKGDGTYTITCLQHAPEKERLVDQGITFDLESINATVHSQIPPEVQHLVADIQGANHGWQVIARWDTPRLINGGRFQVKLMTQDTP
ncbi:hypothetical protein IR150_18395, partial [Providencia alcalifaciens]|uniref:phage tail tip protein J-related protein n=1 Tax=Providencia alcalifaciens TaxID=126385 RepID=UPI001809B742|nr:hypothetical protein [Providencia alcalifaciens]NYS91913.1 hypothetical protein [Providencia alcalifaciens]